MELFRKHETAIWLALTFFSLAIVAAAFLFGAKQPLLFIIPGILAIFALGLRDQLTRCARQQERSESLMEAGQQLGFDFSASGPFNVLGWPDSFELTKRASAMTSHIDPDTMLGRFVSLAFPKAKNVMRQSAEDRHVAIFDFEFSENEVTYNKGVVAIQAPQLNLPYFRLVPKTLWHRMAGSESVYGGHRLSKESVCPDNIDEIVEVLGPYCELEAGSGFLLLYEREHRPLTAGDVGPRINEALQVYNAVADQELAASQA